MSEKSIWPETEFACNGGGGCVIVDRVAGAVVIRDSKNPYQPGLVFSRKEYVDFRRVVLVIANGDLPRAQGAHAARAPLTLAKAEGSQ